MRLLRCVLGTIPSGHTPKTRNRQVDDGIVQPSLGDDDHIRGLLLTSDLELREFLRTDLALTCINESADADDAGEFGETFLGDFTPDRLDSRSL